MSILILILILISNTVSVSQQNPPWLFIGLRTDSEHWLKYIFQDIQTVKVNKTTNYQNYICWIMTKSKQYCTERAVHKRDKKIQMISLWMFFCTNVNIIQQSIIWLIPYH